MSSNYCSLRRSDLLSGMFPDTSVNGWSVGYTFLPFLFASMILSVIILPNQGLDFSLDLAPVSNFFFFLEIYQKKVFSRSARDHNATGDAVNVLV